jgi:predicted SnoaL-like aldol condensation-catalyzing enzyme
MRTSLALATACLLGACHPAPTDTERNRKVVADFAKMFYDERNVRGAFEKYVADGYIQHNPNIADGRAAAIAALQPMFSRQGAQFDVKRILVDDDMAVIHLRGRGSASDLGGAVADIYRLKDGKIVEHWDVVQPVPEDPANDNTMF